MIEEIEEVKIDLLREKEIIRIGAKITEPKKTADLLILKKSLMEKKKVSKKGFLIKKKDFQVKDKILETKLFTVLILCLLQSTLGKSVSHVEI